MAATKDTHQTLKIQASTQCQSPDIQSIRAANPRIPTGTATNMNPAMIGVERIGS